MMQVGVQSCGPKLPILKDFELTQSGEGRTSCVGHRKRPGRWMLPSILATGGPVLDASGKALGLVVGIGGRAKSCK